MKPGTVIVPAADFAREAAQRIADRILERIEAGRELTVALSGGSTPEPIYQLLAARANLPWEEVGIFQVDERAVPPDHADSNYLLIHRTLLAEVRGLEERTRRMPAEQPNLTRAAHSYSTLLPKRLDIAILGIGEDGHTASLFPGDDAVLELAHRVAPARAPTPPHRRMTLTRPVLERARCIFVLARGAAKAMAVHRALVQPGPVSECPARVARRGVWILDTEAAGAL